MNEGSAVVLAASIDPPVNLNDVGVHWVVERSDGEVVATSDEASFTFVPSDNGWYKAIVAATGSDTIEPDEIVIAVTKVAPNLTISGPKSVAEGTPYSLDLHSYDPGDDVIEHWTVNWGDGGPAETVPGNPLVITHVYANGPFVPIITASAVDEDGEYVAVMANRVEVTKLDASFGSGGEIRIGTVGEGFGRVIKLLVLPDDKFLAVGEIAGDGGAGAVARFNGDGSLDTTFAVDGVMKLNPGNTTAISDATVDSRGRIVISTSAGIYRLLTTGQLDESFGTHGRVLADRYVYEMAVDSADQVVYYANANGSLSVKRLLANGTSDASFSSHQPAFFVNEIALDALNRPILTGTVYDSSNGDVAISRLKTDGHIDAGFGTNGRVAIDFDGREDSGLHVAVWQSQIIVSGQSTVGLSNDNRDITLIRLHENGSLDTTFTGQGKQRVDLGGFQEPAGMFVTTDGHILVGGLFGWARFDAQGSAETIAPSGPLMESYTIAQAFDGHVLQAGILERPSGGQDFGIARYLDDGALDLTFGQADSDGRAGVTSLAFGRGASEEAADVVVDLPNGATLVGTWRNDGLTSFAVIMRYGADGELDVTFGDNGYLTIHSAAINEPKSIALDSVGRILVLVQHYELDPGTIWRFLPDGSPDNTFGADTGNSVALPVMVLDSMQLAPDGDIVVAGNVLVGSHANQVAIVKLDGGTGALEAGFGTGGVLYTDFGLPSVGSFVRRIHDLAIDPIGRLSFLFAYWSEQTIGPQLLVARYLADGALDSGFGIGATFSSGSLVENHDGIVALGISEWTNASLTIDSDGRLVGAVRAQAFRLTSDGKLDDSFGTGGVAAVPLEVMQLLTDEFNRPLLVGIGGIARLTPSGGPDPSFAPNGFLPLPKSTLRQVAIDDAGALTVAGKVVGPDGSDDVYVARILAANAQLLVHVRNVAPEALPGQSQLLDEGELATLHGGVSDAGSEDTHTFHWQVVASNGQQIADSHEQDFSFVLAEEGTYAATLTVTDNDGASSTSAVEVIAQHVPDPTLECSLLQVGFNTCVVSGGAPGASVHLVVGIAAGEKLLPEYGARVDVADAQVVASGVIDVNGNATLQALLTSAQLDNRVLLQAFTQKLVTRTTNVVIIGDPLRAESQGIATGSISLSDVLALRKAAIAQWESTGLSLAQSLLLRSVTVSITDLPADVLGQTVGTDIYLDAAAAGTGWFVDATPLSKAEFTMPVASAWQALPGTAAFGRSDLLSVLLHEMGHVLGRGHSPTARELMSARLALGTRALPAGQGLTFDPLDAKRDGLITPLDALLIINRLNALGPSSVSDTAALLCDVNFDGAVTPIDVLLVINRLNAGAGAAGEAATIVDVSPNEQSMVLPASPFARYGYYDWWRPIDQDEADNKADVGFSG